MDALTRQRRIATTTGSASSTGLYQAVSARRRIVCKHPRYEAFEETITTNFSRPQRGDSAGRRARLSGKRPKVQQVSAADSKGCRSAAGGFTKKHQKDKA
jgi:hypothetical protein